MTQQSEVTSKPAAKKSGFDPKHPCMEMCADKEPCMQTCPKEKLTCAKLKEAISKDGCGSSCKGPAKEKALAHYCSHDGRASAATISDETDAISKATAATSVAAEGKEDTEAAAGSTAANDAAAATATGSQEVSADQIATAAATATGSQ